MKFKGQVKIPELDSPGVPAVILIEDPQTELFVEGESLGRWSLADVRAERLIASAFSLNLDGDEVTFIADDPINFAYGGVDQMAKVWARYKTMTMPRRMVATSRSRKGTKPSRIGDLRSAIEETLSDPAPATAPDPFRPAQVDKPIVAMESVPDPVPAVVESEDRAVHDVEIDSEPTVEPRAAEVAEPETLLAPAAELESSTPAVEQKPTAVVPSEEMFQPPPPQAAPRPPNQESVFKDVVPWAGQSQETEEEPASSDADEKVEADPFVPEPAAPVEESPIAASITAAVDAADREPAESERDTEDHEEDPTGVDPDQSVPWLEPATAEPPAPPRRVEPAAIVESEPPPAPEQPRYVVDLGAFEQNDRAVVRAEPTLPDDSGKMVLEPALAGVGEKGGIMGAVRSAFVRNRDVHDHEYVAAPGGIGIVRNICAHCGHISIGVSE